MPQRRRQIRPKRPELPPGGLLDWSDRSHWSDLARPCRYCQGPTNLLDSQRKPAHKTCAEEAIARQIEEASESYENERNAAS